MTQLCIIGHSRIARSLVVEDSKILVISVRRHDFLTALKSTIPIYDKYLVTARDPLASYESNISLLHYIEDLMLQSGICWKKIFHCGSYSVGYTSSNYYRIEKQLLEQAAISGTLVGCVLRLPIILINDERFKKTLSSITWGIQQGMIEPKLRVAVLYPSELLKILQELTVHLDTIEIMPARICTLEQLIAKFDTPPIDQPLIDERLQVFIDYTNRLRNGENITTHYETQAKMARTKVR